MKYTKIDKIKKGYKFKTRGYISDKELRDFNKHEDLEFWAGAGNAVNMPNGSVHGSCSVRNKYPIMLGVEHYKAQEQIQSKNDRWFKLVEFIIGSCESS